MSLSGSAEVALRQAEVEGLALQRSEGSSTGIKGVAFNGNNTGYKGVSFDSRAKSKPYRVQMRRGGKMVRLGSFATVEEAALCYARTPEAQAAAAAPPAPPPLTAEEALRQAEAEGLTLLKSESSSTNSTGFKGVAFNGVNKSKPYRVQVCRVGKKVYLGCFATAEEAALCYARTPEAQAAAAAPPAPPPLTAEEVLRQAEAEGLTLQRSERSKTGYKGVGFDSSQKSRPYTAYLSRGGKQVTLGYFATPEEAALCYARSPEAQAAAAAPPEPQPLTAEEALWHAEAEGLTLLRSESSTSGYKGVIFRSGKSKPYKAHVYRGGKEVHLGVFATAEEAALCYTRTPEAQAAAAAPPEPPPLTAEEALRHAEAEGLTLRRSEGGSTGYKYVGFVSSAKSKPYQAQVWRGGTLVHLGCFATAEEAALCYARTPEAQAAAEQLTATSSKKRKVKS